MPRQANWFIALPVVADAWFERLSAPPGVRLFGPSDLHLTVAFLGAVGEERALSAFELASGFPLAETQVRLGRVEALGSRHRPSAFSALLSDGRLTVESAIAAARGAMWERAQATPDKRHALAHVTLARPGRKLPRSQLTEAARWARALDLGAPLCLLDRIALYTANEDREQSLFRKARELPLRAASAS